MDTGKLLVQGGLYAGIWQKIYELNIGDDPFTKLLMHFNGPNNAKEIVDSGLQGYVVSMAGDAKLTSVQSKVGRGSYYFDGTADALTVPDSEDWYFGTGDFTIDCWVRFSVLPSNTATIISQTTGGGNDCWRLLHLYTERMLFQTIVGGGVQIDMRWSWSPVANVWYHIALVRNGLTDADWYFFVDGVEQSHYSQSGASTAMPNIATSLYIGAMQDPGPTQCWYGYIDEFRISKGIARWTANFTPQTTPYASDGNTQLLIHGEPHDTSAYLNIPTFVSGAKISKSPIYRFGTGSLLLDGNSDYITFPDSDDWDFGAGDFTVDCWVRFNSFATALHVIASTYHGTGDLGWGVRYSTSSGMYLNFPSTTLGAWTLHSAAWTAQLNTWYHIAVVGQSGATIKTYIDGALLDTWTVDYSISGSAGLLQIGAFSAGPSNYLNGWMDEIRVSKGIARWTANFMPSSVAYTSDSYTKLLLHFDGDYTDYSGSAHGNATLAGTAQETSLWKFGGGSMKFNGSTQYLTVPDSDDWVLGGGTGNFTIDCWVRFNTLSGSSAGCFYNQRPDANSQVLWHYYAGDGLFYVVVMASLAWVIKFTTPWAPVVNRWYHVALIRKGLANANTDWAISVDGVLKTGADLTLVEGAWNGTMPNLTANLEIGGRVGGDLFLDGYIDEYRISNGIARWTTAFVPSTTAYTADSYTKLLLHGDLNFIDSETTPKTVTPVASVSITANGVFSESSLVLNGSTDYVTLPDSGNWYFGAGNFTIDCWVRRTSDGSVVRSIATQDDGSASGSSFNIRFLADNTLRVSVYWGSNVGVATSTGTVTADGRWHHIAVVRDVTNIRLFIDGVMDGTVNISTNTLNNSSSVVRIGSNYDAQHFAGYINEFRISKGIARWTANFTPPTTAYTDDTGQALTSLSIAGLDGDTDIQYILLCRFVNGYAGTTEFQLQLNGDTGNNYGREQLFGVNTTVTATQHTSQPTLRLGNATALDEIAFVRAPIHAKSGQVRTVWADWEAQVSGPTIGVAMLTGAVWSNTTDNITSLLVSADQVQGIGIGSSVELYSRRG